MQGIEIIALRKYENITEGFPQFENRKLSEDEQWQKSFNRKFQKQHDFLYYMILNVSNSVADYNRLLKMTAIEIVDYYLSTQING